MSAPQIYLIVASEDGWDVNVFRDLEGLQKLEKGLLSKASILHLGFARPTTLELNEWFPALPPRLLATMAARHAMFPCLEFGNPIRISSGSVQLFPVTCAWNEFLADESQIETSPSVESSHASSYGTADIPASSSLKSITAEPSVRDFLKGSNDQLRQRLGRLSDAELETPLKVLDLSVRVHHVLSATGYLLVKDLARLSTRDLMKLPNFGWKSVVVLLQELDRLAGRKPEKVFSIGKPYAFGSSTEVVEQIGGPREGTQSLSSHTPTAAGLLTAEGESEGSSLKGLVTSWLVSMTAGHRRIMHLRMGFSGQSMTLEEIGQEAGVSRERIRQIEVKKVKQLQAEMERVGVSIPENIEARLKGRSSPLYLDTLSQESAFFLNCDFPHDVWEFLIDKLSAGTFNLLKLPSGIVVISRVSQEEWEILLREARDLVSRLASERSSISTARSIVDGLLIGKGDELRDEFWAEVSELAHIGPGDDGEQMFVGYGRSMEGLVRVVLSESSRPMHFSEIASQIRKAHRATATDRFVHAAASRVGLLLGRGTFGLKQHLPITSAQCEWLCGAATRFMANGPEGRQWHAQELYEGLEQDCDFADQFDHYTLSEVVRTSPDIQYLGRHILTLGGEKRLDTRDRIDFRQAVEAILMKNGGPLSASEIYQQIELSRGLSSVAQIHPDDVVVRLGPGLWGLRPRDFKLSDERLEWAFQKLESFMENKKTGIHISEVQPLLSYECIKSESEAWALIGLGAHLGRLKVSKGNYSYPFNWSSANRKTVLEAIRDLLTVTDNVTPADIAPKISEAIGRLVTLSEIRTALRSAGAIYSPDSATWGVVDVSTEDVVDN